MPEKQVRPDRVAVYIRWSTDDQSDGTTLDVQREACRHFILSQGWQFRTDLLFVDDGYSGATMDRPGLARLRRLCREGEVDCVVVYKLDRLSRSVVDTVKLVMEEWDGLVHLKSAREAVDTASPMGRQVFYLLVSYAEWERNVIRERTASGKWKRAQEGRCPGFVAPYGYRNAGEGRFAVHPAEAPVVQRIFDQALAARSARQIALVLNAAGVPSRQGRGWSAAAISKLLRNPAYVGVLAYGRTAGAGAKRVRQDEPAVRVGGVFPALVDQDVFTAVQAQLTARRPAAAAPRALSSPSLLTGLAVCARCGQAIVSHVREGGRYRYYRCGGQFSKGNTVCACGFIPQEAADAEVRRQLLELYGGAQRLAHYHGLAGSQARAETARLQAELRQATVRARAAAQGEARIQRAFLTGELDGRRLNELLALAAQEQQQAEATVARLRQGLAAQQALAGRMRPGAAPGAPAPRDGLRPDEQKALLRALADRVLLYRDRATGETTLEVSWRIDRSVPNMAR